MEGLRYSESFSLVSLEINPSFNGLGLVCSDLGFNSSSTGLDSESFMEFEMIIVSFESSWSPVTLEQGFFGCGLGTPYTPGSLPP